MVFNSRSSVFAILYILSHLLYHKVDVNTLESEWDIAPVKTSTCNGYEFAVKGSFTKLLADNKTFRVQLARVILQSVDNMGQSASVYWECTPIPVAGHSGTVADNSVRFCVTRAVILEGAAPDFYAFSEYFKSASLADKTVTFPNLGRDALLVAPTPKEHKSFACLATWLRETRHDEESWDEVF